MTAPTRRATWLSRNLVVLSGVSLLQDAASELLYPILPIFLTVTLGAPASVVGLVEGLAEGAASITKLLSGRLSDRFRRRPLIGAGYGMAAVGKLLIALAYTWPLVLVARCVDRLGKGIRGAPRDALLVVGVPVEARGRVFGLHRMADTTGAVIGPLLGLAAYELMGHRIRPLLWLAVIPAVLSVLLVLLVRESPAPLRRDAPAAPSAEDAAGLPPAYWRVVTVLTLFALVNFPDALLLLRLKEIGFSVVAVILAYVGYNAVYALLSFPLGALSDRWSRPHVFGTGLLFFALGYVGLGLTHDHRTAWLLLGAYGTFTAATDGVGKAWISSLVPASAQGSAQGVFQGLAGGGILIAGLWAGLAWGGDGRLPLLVSGTVGGLMGLWLLLGGASQRVAQTAARS